MNPRVSRSSALASKATGYPIAKVAAKLAVGYTLDEIPNDLTGTTPASFEPTLDYVVVKFPRFAFEKFPGRRHDARHADEVRRGGDGDRPHLRRGVPEGAPLARDRRPDAWELPEGAHPGSAPSSSALEASCSTTRRRSRRRRLARLKRLGISDAEIAARAGTSEELVRAKRRGWGVRPAYRRVDSCAAEVEASSNYFYSTWGEADEAPPDGAKPRVVILGSGPNRIGQGIEFDYCCVHAAQALPRARLRGGDGQLQPGDGLDRLRHVGPPLLRAARRGGGARDLRPRAPGRRRHPVRGSDPAEACARDRGRGLADPRDAVRRGRPRRGPRALRRPLRRARRRRARRGRRRRRRARPSTSPRRSAIRCSCARRTCSAAATCRSATTNRRSPRRAADRRARARRQLPRGRDRDRRRRALRRAGDVRRGRDGARRGGGRALGRLLVRPAGAVARRRRRSSRSRRRFARLAPALGVVGLVNVQLGSSTARSS